MSTKNFIFNFNVHNDKEAHYASSTQRSTAGLIDSIIVFALRAIFSQIIGTLWFIDQVKQFLLDFKEKFGTETPKTTPEHLEFIKNHAILLDSFILILAVFLIGLIYHAYFNSSNWQATIGKRIFKIIMVNKNGHKISFMDGVYHYLLSVSPFLYIIILMMFMQKNNFSIYETLGKHHILSILGIAMLLATHMGAFNKKRINLFDYLMEIEFHKSRIATKFPWNNNQN